MEKRIWANKQNLTCVILAGGSSTRLLPLTSSKQKTMIEVKEKPIICYVIEYWKKFADNFVFVVKYRKEDVINYVRRLPINSQFAEPKELKGIADGVSYTKDLVSDKFIVVLGDCLCSGYFNFPDKMEQGIGVCKTENEDDIKRSYSVEIKDDLVSKVVEKPKIIINDLCGMGFYFFDKIIFNYIEITKPSSLRGEIEITNVIQNMIDGREKIKPISFAGEYLNITVPSDLEKAERILK